MATDFVNVSRAQCTASDLLRMESLMLEKLNWDMFVPTSVLFLQKVSGCTFAILRFSQSEAIGSLLFSSMFEISRR